MRILPAVLVIFILLGCGRPAEKPAAVLTVEKIVATVNGEPITNKDLKLALALRMAKDPSLKITPNTLKEQLDMEIDERLAFQHRKMSDSKVEILDKNLRTK